MSASPLASEWCHDLLAQLHTDLDGRVRTADVGLLYDPARAEERALCARWKMALGEVAPALVVRRNYPYAGKGTGSPRGFASACRRRTMWVWTRFNQKLVAGPESAWCALRDVIAESLRMTIAVDTLRSVP